MIGSLRHHGQVPWDDDADIFIAQENRKKTINILESIPNYIAPRHGNLNKFYNIEQSLSVPGYSKRKCGWPMVDIIFYETVNSTHILHRGASLHFYKKKHLFPPRYRVFWNWILPVPRKVESIVEKTYKTKLSTCQDTIWNHRKQNVLHEHPKEVNCSKLEQFFPFVHKVLKNKECREILVKDQRILRDIPCY
ncbi:unnamed protein product [Dimorphilus gyrociliatus]|uniref:LicD/FKTN/FKRP nucleotidyltransferase domain-containing protein n=1 Tax=Dimorphilus gyrociliatus TaxID=2664684 RepID=A0A7I8V6U8_9ANNE|nr:unnamed protein product [Dimorphilus gyrociliatus]